MHSERLLKNDPLRVLSVSMFPGMVKQNMI